MTTTAKLEIPLIDGAKPLLTTMRSKRLTKTPYQRNMQKVGRISNFGRRGKRTRRKTSCEHRHAQAGVSGFARRQARPQASSRSVMARAIPLRTAPHLGS